MNKTRRTISHRESQPQQRGLRLSKDVIRTLTTADLSRAMGGSCETGSLTTDHTLSPPATKTCK